MSIYERYKPTALSNVAERKSEVAKITNQYGDNDNDGRIKRVQLTKDGTYTVRMYPAHPIEGAISYEPKVIFFLPGWVNKKDENGQWIKKEDGGYERVLGTRPVFNSKVHGGADHDLVDTYISLVTRKAEQLYPDAASENDKKAYLYPITGQFKDGVAIYTGIKPIRTFVLYGELITGQGDNQKREFCEIEIKPSVQKQLQKIAAMEAGDDPLGTDGCFTDPKEGRPFKLTVNSSAAKQTKDFSLYYSVSILNETTKEVINGRTVSVLKTYPLEVEDLEAFDKVDPLINYRTIFKHSDLQIQLEGLQLFDEEHGYGILEEDEFKEVYAYLDKKFPQPDEEEESNDNHQYSSSKNQDVFDLMDMKELKDYIKTHKLSIVVLQRYTEEDLREMIREVEGSDGAEEVEEVGEVIGDEGKDIADGELSDRLSALKSKLR